MSSGVRCAMSSRHLVLASASTARLRVLKAAGLDPEVVVSGVAEDIASAPTDAMVRDLAVAKAEAVAALRPDSIVIGCDSMLDVDGEAYGKPASPGAALDLWLRLRRSARSLVTGHCVIDTATTHSAVGVSRTTVRFGNPDLTELEAYVQTGEPLRAAGGFTIDGFGAPFVDGVNGDPNNVLGLSLSLFRHLLRELGVPIIDLWGSSRQA
jgi:septum formation protein